MKNICFSIASWSWYYCMMIGGPEEVHYFHIFTKSSTYGHADVIMHFHCCPFVHFSLALDGKSGIELQQQLISAHGVSWGYFASVISSANQLRREKSQKCSSIFLCNFTYKFMQKICIFIFHNATANVKKHTSILHNTMRVDGVACSRKEWYRPYKREREIGDREKCTRVSGLLFQLDRCKLLLLSAVIF